MPSPLSPIIAELGPVMRRADLAGFHDVCVRLDARSRVCEADHLSEALGELAPVLGCWPRGVFGGLATVAGSWVRRGADAKALAEFVPPCALATMRQRATFSRLWPRVSGGRPEPSEARPPAMTDLIGRFLEAAPRLGLKPKAATGVALAWFDTRHWIRLMLALTVRQDFRAATEVLPDIAAAAGELGEERLRGLARVLDDEPLLVVEHRTGREFRMTMSGIGDNGQLYTLLAHRLIGGGHVRGERPLPDWVGRATSAVPGGSPIEARFDLVDATGADVIPSGHPADIAKTEGVRTLVLHPPTGRHTWNTGRPYEDMLPALRESVRSTATP